MMWLPAAPIAAAAVAGAVGGGDGDSYNSPGRAVRCIGRPQGILANFGHPYRGCEKKS